MAWNSKIDGWIETIAAEWSSSNSSSNEGIPAELIQNGLTETGQDRTDHESPRYGNDMGNPIEILIS